ncbi:hypothetical protein [Photorhabdus khanii]|uniref:hypothetical protein n=1 Tax=Photorhabdus khanii TaxID=1004150 RepID=UPI001050541E|nr:hypothetical protein [Photorhabdus khanii]
MRLTENRDKTSLAHSTIGICTILVRNGINIQYAFNFSIAGLDARLNRRYQSLVKQPMTPATSLAPAIKDIASAQKTPFATTKSPVTRVGASYDPY